MHESAGRRRVQSAPSLGVIQIAEALSLFALLWAALRTDVTWALPIGRCKWHSFRVFEMAVTILLYLAMF